MKWIKLFEEFKGGRIKVTTEEKRRLREIARIIIKYCKVADLTSDINEKYKLEFDLGDLKNLITDNRVYHSDDSDLRKRLVDRTNKQHKLNKYKIVDDFAKKLSSERGTEVIFDRENGCFITKSGKAMTTINIVSEYLESSVKDSTAGYHNTNNVVVFIDYNTGDIINNNDDESHEKIIKGKYVDVFDFTGSQIIMSINRNIRRKSTNEDGLLSDIFGTLYHEFIHAKDPLVWAPKYLDNKEIYNSSGNGPGVYSSHDTEVQTISNQFLELVEYYFERTLRGDKDGNGVNYNLTKEKVNKVFIPNIMQIVDFIDGKVNEISEDVELALAGTNKSTNSAYNTWRLIVDMRNEEPEDAKVIRQWMRDDFIHLVDYYNVRAIEINKRKEKGQELPLLHKGFPFEIEPVKATPTNTEKVGDTIGVEPNKSGNDRPKLPIEIKSTNTSKPIKPSSGNSKLKFVSNQPKLPSWVKNPVVWASDEMEKILNKNLNVLASAYSKCFSKNGANAVVDIKKKLETLSKDLKTNNPVRIKDSVRVFYASISPKLSDDNVSNWLKSPDGIKWGETMMNYENLVSHIIK